MSHNFWKCHFIKIVNFKASGMAFGQKSEAFGRYVQRNGVCPHNFGRKTRKNFQPVRNQHNFASKSIK